MPRRLKSPGSVASTEIRMGSMAEVSAVALAKPRWMTIRKAASTAKIASGPRWSSPVCATT
ncbi:hypothetical protein D3C86_1434750 [compost metagenome]